MTVAPPPLRYWLGVASRIVAAAGGGYAVAAAVGMLLALVLPIAPAERAIGGALVGIAVLPVVAIACFRVRSAGRAWAMIALLCLACGGPAALAWTHG